jgi:hypothetical protein
MTEKAVAKPSSKESSGGAPSTTKGELALVFGISSLIIPLLGIATGIVAIVLANLQRKEYPTGMATAGMILGIIGLTLQLLVLIVAFAAFLYLLPVMQTVQ